MNAPEFTMEWFGPDEASRFLEGQHTNRRIKPALVEQLVRDIQNGDYRFDGNCIKYDAHGRGLDGQNRATAVVESGLAIQTGVMRGLDPSAMQTMDTGRPRTASDVLAIAGGVNTKAVAALAQAIYLYREGGITLGSRTLVPSARLSPRQVLEASRLEPSIQRVASWAHTVAKGLRPMTQTGIGLIAHEWPRGRGEAMDFFDHVALGADLRVQSPELALSALLRKQAPLAHRNRTYTDPMLTAIAAIALGKSVSGAKVRLLRAPSGASFPIFDDL